MDRKKGKEIEIPSHTTRAKVPSPWDGERARKISLRLLGFCQRVCAVIYPNDAGTGDGRRMLMAMFQQSWLSREGRGKEGRYLG